MPLGDELIEKIIAYGNKSVITAQVYCCVKLTMPGVKNWASTVEYLENKINEFNSLKEEQRLAWQKESFKLDKQIDPKEKIYNKSSVGWGEYYSAMSNNTLMDCLSNLYLYKKSQTEILRNNDVLQLLFIFKHRKDFIEPKYKGIFSYTIQTIVEVFGSFSHFHLQFTNSPYEVTKPTTSEKHINSLQSRINKYFTECLSKFSIDAFCKHDKDFGTASYLRKFLVTAGNIPQYRNYRNILIDIAKASNETSSIDVNNINELILSIEKHKAKNKSTQIDSDSLLLQHILYLYYINKKSKLTFDFNEYIREELENNSVLYSIKQFYTASTIVNYYKPESIDYFMMNLESLAPYEFYCEDNSSNEMLKMTPEQVKPIKSEIHKYTKFIMADILLNSISDTAENANRNKATYIDKTIALLNRKAVLYCNSDFNKFVSNYFNSITFNYDTLLQNKLSSLIDLNIDNNINHVYGALALKATRKKDHKEVYMFKNFAHTSLWQNFFQSEASSDILLRYAGKFGKPIDNTNEFEGLEIKDIFKQLNNCIKWIGEENKEERLKKRQEYQKLIKQSDEIYILGFGFDKNNLYEIGITNERGVVKYDLFNDKIRTIYIAGGNSRIIQLVANWFDCEITTPIVTTSNGKQSYTYKLRAINTNSPSGYLVRFIITDKYLPEAMDDFDV